MSYLVGAWPDASSAAVLTGASVPNGAPSAHASENPQQRPTPNKDPGRGGLLNAPGRLADAA